ncbi:recombination protein RecR [Candidatus Peregrinibacteria bacterium CG_4_10_14_0_2_um_filter_43_11]|nr:MAG: recombination protein RecR [Candidatus Peregrinibacteria bacterium CG_4_10_14_0_2_um_filter_43_11]
MLPESIQKTIEEFNKLPGIGSKSAQRLVFYLLRKRDEDVERFGEIIQNLKKGIHYCKQCANLCTNDVCAICQNDARNQEVICVVEDIMDLIAIENTGEYKGLYHVLHGVISPIEGVGPDDLKITELMERLKAGTVHEIIVALNSSMEGEATLSYLMRYIKPLQIKVTRIARGIPVGGDIEYADSQTVRRALEGRMEY